MATRSLFDQLTQSMANAITDVREKLIEEGWFGRTTASQERMSEDVGNIVSTQGSERSATPQMDPMFNELRGQARTDDEHVTGPTTLETWEQIRDRLTKPYGYQFERENDQEHDLDR